MKQESKNIQTVDYIKIIENINAFIEHEGLLRERLAERMDITFDLFRDFLSGKVTDVDEVIQFASKLASILGYKGYYFTSENFQLPLEEEFVRLEKLLDQMQDAQDAISELIFNRSDFFSSGDELVDLRSEKWIQLDCVTVQDGYGFALPAYDIATSMATYMNSDSDEPTFSWSFRYVDTHEIKKIGHFLIINAGRCLGGDRWYVLDVRNSLGELSSSVLSTFTAESEDELVKDTEKYIYDF